MTRVLRTLFLATIVCSLSSCAKSPQESLVGRWYNSDMMIRFREDGSVLYNSRAGRAVGRYVYDGAARQLSKDDTPYNVTLDVLMNNRRVQLDLRVEFLGNDRLQLQELTIRSPGNDPVNVSRSGILKRDTAATPG